MTFAHVLHDFDPEQQNIIRNLKNATLDTLTFLFINLFTYKYIELQYLIRQHKIFDGQDNG